MDKSGKSREWVKTVAIIFLAVLLVLTFFSNTISNMSLPEVSAVEVTDGSITAKVRATGKVSAIGNNEVKAEGTRTIAAVKVKEGQEVSEGDILFVMGEAGSEELEVATDARDSAYYANERAKVSYPIDTSSYSYNVALEEMDAANNRRADARAAYDRAVAEHAGELQAASDNLAEKQDYFYQVKAAYDTEQASIDGDIAIKQAARDAASEQYTYAQEAYYFEPDSEEKKNNKDATEAALATAESELSAALNKQNPHQGNYDFAYGEVQNAEARYEAALAAADCSEYLAAVNAAESAYTSAQAAYASASASYQSSKAQYNQSWAQANINVQETQNTLDKKQAKVDNLQGIGEDINVYAKVSGIVSAVNFSSGDKVIKDDIMAIIEVPDMGYKMEVSVTKDQANRLKVGDVGTATNYYWGKSTEGTVTAIKADPRDPQSKRIVEFSVDGDVSNGQELTLSVGQKSASYDYLVPKSAVKSDNNGYFVLVITSKSNALGNRYFAKRVSVEILAEDDSSRAISGDIGYGDFVITNSSTKVNSGDQVKLADS